jgi:putative membrane protein
MTKRMGILVFFVASLAGALGYIAFRAWGGPGWYMPHMGYYGMGMIGFFLLVCLILFALLVWIRPDRPSSRTTAIELLRQRLARGDISEEEYRSIRTILQGEDSR